MKEATPPDQIHREGAAPTPSSGWPLLLRLSPRALMLAVVGWLGIAWGLFIAVDIFDLVQLGTPLFPHLFNDRPVEWTQWILLALAIAAAAYLAGRLQAEDRAGASRFFFLLAIGLGFMLIEDAGDVRHTISGYARDMIGYEILGLHHAVVTHVPYYAALAAVPVYAVLRYGRHPWVSVRTRFYLGGGVLLYAVAALASSLAFLDDFYVGLGAWVDRVLLGGRLPVPGRIARSGAHFMLVDSVIEESVELLAVAMMLAAILSFAGYVRSGQSDTRPRSPTDPEREALDHGR